MKRKFILPLVILCLIICGILINHFQTKPVIKYEVSDLKESFIVPIHISYSKEIKKEDYKNLVDAINEIRVVEEIKNSSSKTPILINLNPREKGIVIVGDESTIYLAEKWYKAKPETLKKIHDFCKSYGYEI